MTESCLALLYLIPEGWIAGKAITFLLCLNEGARQRLNRLGEADIVAKAVQEAQVDEDIDQRILVGNGLAVAQMRAFDIEGDNLRIDPLDGGMLVVDGFVELAVAAQGVAN